MLGVGAKKKTYVDDIFSTFLYTGSGSSGKQIVNNINLSSNGGMVWLKSRDSTGTHVVLDTVRTNGFDKSVTPDNDGVEVSGWNSTANSNGFTINTTFSNNNSSGSTYSSWTFGKAPGFFDVVTYTGTGNALNVSHSLGSVPGMIMIKNISNSADWAVYHKSIGAEKYLKLNDNAAMGDTWQYWDDTEPTATQFTVRSNSSVNTNGDNYVAYLFAGGESTAATARSVDFDGNDKILIPDSDDFHFGNGDFTIEFWLKSSNEDNDQAILNQSVGGASTSAASSWLVWGNSTNQMQFYVHYTGGSGWDTYITTSGININDNAWHHYAIVRDGATLNIYVDGTLNKSGNLGTNSLNNANRSVEIGHQPNSSGADSIFLTGSISNVRIVKGTAVYTSSFRPPTEPLTNITNTKLLCCNNSSTTGSTVTPGTITTSGDPTANTDSPFDDPAGFIFGENEDKNAIKCGSYTGNGNADGPEIDIGWEPQFVMVKRSSGDGHWVMMDSMRGISNGTTSEYSDDKILYPNLSNAEGTTARVDLMSTGFKITDSNNIVNGNNDTYIYLAIRRSDGYIGKPAKLGTDAFAMDTGAGSSTIPNFDSGFPVDFALVRKPAVTDHWDTTARLIGENYVRTSENVVESDYQDFVWDSNAGWQKTSAWDSNYQSWMWKRHAGFDVVTYTGDDVAGRQISHSLSKAPEMIWVKRRDTAAHWIVGHKGLNGGTTPWDYYAVLSLADAEVNNNLLWNDTAPTSTHFTVGSGSSVNDVDSTYIAMLFASVDGISKVGSYTGTGSSGNSITLGFQPRFLLVKNVSNSSNWGVYDTVRGWTGTDDKFMNINQTYAEGTTNIGPPTSTGFTVNATNTFLNSSGDTFIYYAHA